VVVCSVIELRSIAGRGGARATTDVVQRVAAPLSNLSRLLDSAGGLEHFWNIASLR
jgi:hypothetical protein